MKKLLPLLLIFLAACHHKATEDAAFDYSAKPEGIKAPVMELGATAALSYSGLSNQTIIVPAGSYAGISLINNKNVIIDVSKCVFSALPYFNGGSYTTLRGGTFANISGTGRWDGNSNHVRVVGSSYYNCPNLVFDASDNNNYTGDTSTFKMYMNSFDSLTFVKCGQWLQGSWGGANTMQCYMDSVTFSNIRCDSTTGNGTYVRATIFQMGAWNLNVTYEGINNILGDVGGFYMVGNYNFHDNFKTGGRGYWIRNWHCSLAGSKSVNDYFHNNIDLNSTTYGGIDERSEAAQFSKYSRPTGACYFYNNTSGNNYDNIGYWSSMCVIGACDSGFQVNLERNLGFNITPCCGTNSTAKPKIVMDQSNGEWRGDTAQNVYLAQGLPAVDTLTGKQANYQGIGALPGAVVVVPPAPTPCPPVVPCPVCPPVVPCVQRTAIGYSVNAKTGAVSFSYDNGSVSLKKPKKK